MSLKRKNLYDFASTIYWGLHYYHFLFQREVDFLERIVSHRASSYSKFEDDFYGESIKTLSDYRQWVRKQHEKKKIQEKYDQKKDTNDENIAQRTKEP